MNLEERKQVHTIKPAAGHLSEDLELAKKLMVILLLMSDYTLYNCLLY